MDANTETNHMLELPEHDINSIRKNILLQMVETNEIIENLNKHIEV